MRFAVFTVGLPEFTPEEAVAELHEIGYDGWSRSRTSPPSSRCASASATTSPTSSRWRPQSPTERRSVG